MEILVYQKTFDRINPKLRGFSTEVIPIVMDDEGIFFRNGKKVESGEIHPEAAFGCSDLINGGPSRDFMVFLLRSETIRWVQSGAAGFDHPIFKMLVDKGIQLTNSNAAAIAIAEFVLANVFNVLHPFGERARAQKLREWTRIEFQEMSSKGWLIIGLGNIGQKIAKRAMAFGCEVTGVRRNPDGREPVNLTITPEKIMDVLPDSDVIVLSAPLSSDTKHMVDPTFLKVIKTTSILVNIGRGSLIDEKALLKSLDQGRPARAILDVFETEPLPKESPLWAHPRVHISAHCSSATQEKRIRGDQLFLENLALFMEGKKLKLLVDPTRFDA